MQIKFNFNNFVFCGACLPQVSSVPAAYAVVAGGCDTVIGLSNNDVISLRFLRSLRFVRCVRCVGWKTRLKHICVLYTRIIVGDTRVYVLNIFLYAYRATLTT